MEDVLLVPFLRWFGAHKFDEGKILRGFFIFTQQNLVGIGVVVGFSAILLNPNLYYVYANWKEQ